MVSTTGGKHNEGSQHPCGKAIDIRVWEDPAKSPKDFIENDNTGWITEEQAEQLRSELQEALGGDFTVRNELNHPNGQEVWGGPHIPIGMR